VLDRVVGGGLMRDAAVPGRAGAPHRITAQRPRRRDVSLDRKGRVVFKRLAGLGIEALGPVQLIGVLAALDEAAVETVERVEETVAREMAARLAGLAVDCRVIEHMHADFVPVPGVVRQILEIPDKLAGIDVQGDYRIRVEVVARTELRVEVRGWVAGSPYGE